VAKKLYVGNLSYDTTETTLSELFAEVGGVQSVSLITDRMTGRSKGFAFVEMADDAKAQEAINQLNEREVDGRTIKVAEARPKRDDREGGGSRRQRERR
jgi:cold-inducible RNA-binding protein